MQPRAPNPGHQKPALWPHSDPSSLPYMTKGATPGEPLKRPTATPPTVHVPGGRAIHHHALPRLTLPARHPDSLPPVRQWGVDPPPNSQAHSLGSGPPGQNADTGGTSHAVQSAAVPQVGRNLPPHLRNRPRNLLANGIHSRARPFSIYAPRHRRGVPTEFLYKLACF